MQFLLSLLALLVLSASAYAQGGINTGVPSYDFDRVTISTPRMTATPAYQSPSQPGYTAPRYRIDVGTARHSSFLPRDTVYHFEGGHSMLISPNGSSQFLGPVHMVQLDGYFEPRRPRPRPERAARTYPTNPIRSYEPAPPAFPVQLTD